MWAISLDGTERRPFEDFEEVTWRRLYWDVSNIRIRMTIPQFNSAGLGRRTLIYTDERCQHGHRIPYMIESFRVISKGESSEVEVRGREVGGGMMMERLIYPPDGFSHDAINDVSETVMKHYVDGHLVNPINPARKVPGLILAADQARGDAYQAAGRFQTVQEVLSSVGNATGTGWEVCGNFDELGVPEFEFDTLHGVDRSASVFFDIEFNTVREYEWLSSELDQKTFALVGGRGEAELRSLAEVWLGAAEPEGWDRREMFVDARDVEDDTALPDRGASKLSETNEEDVLRIRINESGSFQYGRDFFLGDIALIRNRDWNLVHAARVVAVEHRIRQNAGAEVTIEVGRTWPSLRKRIQKDDGSSRR